MQNSPKISFLIIIFYLFIYFWHVLWDLPKLFNHDMSLSAGLNTMLRSQFVILEGQLQHDKSQESGQPFPVCFPHRSCVSCDHDLSLYMLMNCPLGVNVNAHMAINFRAANQSFRNWAQQTTAHIRIEAWNDSMWASNGVLLLPLGLEFSCYLCCLSAW